MKLKNYLLDLQERGEEPQINTQGVHKHFKNSADLRKWYVGEHKQEFYRHLKEHK